MVKILDRNVDCWCYEMEINTVDPGYFPYTNVNDNHVNVSIHYK